MRRHLLSIALAWPGIVSGSEIPPAPTAKQQLDYRIAPQTLDKALVEFSLKSGLQVIADGQLTADLISPGVSGNISPTQALQKLLKGSGLVYRFSGAGSVIVEKAPEPSRSLDTILETVTIIGSHLQDDNNYSNQDYALPNAYTATKTDTPIMETPFSVKSITQQVMQDQQVVRMDKALQNVAGVLQEASSGLMRDSFTIRGFTTGNSILTYRDGVPFPQAYANGFSSKRDPANLERIEVLKGPGSILFGRAEPGGIINMVTKQPLANAYYALQQQFGSFDFYRSSADATGPVTEDGKLLYRFNAAYENAGSFADFVSSDRIFVAPVLKWILGPRSQLSAEFEYQRFDETPGAVIPALGNRPAAMPRNRNIREPDFSSNKGNRILAGFNCSHAYNDRWALSQRFYYNAIRADITDTFFRGKADQQGNISRGMGRENVQSDNYFTSLYLTGKIETSGLKQTLLLGGDYYRADDVDPFDVRFIPGNFNVFNPAYGTVGFDDIGVNNRTAFGVDATTSWYGFYLQDQFELPYKLFATAGLRYDQAYQTDHLTNSVSGDEHRASPRGGLLWRPISALSLYASYSENFGAGNGSNGARQILPVQTAQQTELGIKTELLDGRLNASVAYFDLTKQNMAVRDPNNPLLLSAIGEAESRGIELDIAGELTPGWQIIGGYSDLFFAKITHDVDANGGTGNQGNRLPNAPRHSGSVFTSYEIQDGLFRGIKFGGGLNAVSQRQGSQDNRYQVPGHVLVNLLASYSIKAGPAKLTTQLNIDNLFDRYYFVGSNTGGDIFFGAPRTFLGSIRIEY